MTLIEIKIWSDINCPFCYIGKRHLEQAIQNFDAIEVVIEWKSFELDPAADPPPGADPEEYLAKKYGRDLSWAKQMNADMTKMAKQAGIDFHLEKGVLANSFDAHRLVHLGKELNKQDETKEALLKARFVDGKDIGDKVVLLKIADEIGLSMKRALSVLEGDAYASDVREDEKEAYQLGIRGVPFFLINQKYPISGARPASAFLEVFSKLSEN